MEKKVNGKGRESPLLEDEKNTRNLEYGVDNPVFTVEKASSTTLVRPPTRPRSADLPPVGEVEKEAVSNGGLLTPEVSSGSLSKMSSISNGTSLSHNSAKLSHSLSVPSRQGIRPPSQKSTDEKDKLHQRRLRKVAPVQTDKEEGADHLVTDQKSPAISITRVERKDSIGSYHSEHSGRGSVLSMSGVSSIMSERLISLRRKFTSRTETFKERAAAPPSPTSLDSVSLPGDAEKPVPTPSDQGDDDHDPTPPPRKRRLNSFLPSRASASKDGDVDIGFCCCWRCRCSKPAWLSALRLPKNVDPQGRLNLTWLFIVMVAFLYNAVVIPLRFAFGDLVQRDDNVIYWLIVDYVCDFIYVIDITVFEVRTTFLDNGTVQTDPKEMRRNYFNKLRFKFDLICLIPTDLLYLVIGTVFPMLRLNRLFKISAFFEFYERCDQAAKNGHIIRILQTISVMLYLIHVEACGYYFASSVENFSTSWTYNEERFPQVSAYVRCFYVATKTATSIGKNPMPTNNLEYLFMTAYWLSGVFVFALLIGQIRDIFEAAGFVKTHYRETMDITLWYMQSLNLPKHIQDRVRMWFNYNWDQQKTLDENSLIESLPKKMKTDLAIHVHFNTLSKVSLFQDCDKNLLYDLILKLEPVLYLPTDYICKKGEVGTEMYIVMSGQVQVVGGPNNDIVFATLHEGSVFGEISLLALAGGNRRTADVRSKGFSNLFTLSKVDFEEAMADYPEAHQLLKKRAKKLLSQNKKHEKKDKKRDEVEVEDVIKDRTPTPKLMKTVLKMLEPRSSVGKSLTEKRKPRPYNNKVTPAKPDNHVTPPANHNYGDKSRDVEAGDEEEQAETRVQSRVQSRASRRLMARSVSEMVDSEEEEFFSEEEIVMHHGDVDSIHTPTPPPTVSPRTPTPESTKPPSDEPQKKDQAHLSFTATSRRKKTPFPRKSSSPGVDTLLDECEEEIRAAEKKEGISVSYTDSKLDSKSNKDSYNRQVKSPTRRSSGATRRSSGAAQKVSPSKNLPVPESAGVVNRGYVQSPSSHSLEDPKL